MEEIFTVRSTHTGNIYKLAIMPIKHTNDFRIVNLTRGHISKCSFSTYEDAVRDIYLYEELGKNKVLKQEQLE